LAAGLAADFVSFLAGTFAVARFTDAGMGPRSMSRMCSRRQDRHSREQGATAHPELALNVRLDCKP
jgi:hypothetical protein